MDGDKKCTINRGVIVREERNQQEVGGTRRKTVGDMEEDRRGQ